MRLNRRRTKKLIVAFHFSRSDGAGWKCDACRKSGLDRSRKCAWLPGEAASRPVWVWPGGATERCPKSIITAASVRWLELNGFWNRWKPTQAEDLPARDVDAFLLIEREREKERNDG